MNTRIHVSLFTFALMSLLLISCASKQTAVQSEIKTTSKLELDEQIKRFEKQVQKNPKDINALAKLGFLYGSKGDLDKEISFYKRTLDIYPAYKEVHYNLACAYALQKKSGLALKSLEDAFKYGFKAREVIASDRDLDRLRDDPRFKALIKKYFSN